MGSITYYLMRHHSRQGEPYFFSRGGGREKASAAVAARARNTRKEASGCQHCLFSSHSTPRSGRNLPLFVDCTMVSFYVFLALLGTDLVPSTVLV